MRTAGGGVRDTTKEVRLEPVTAMERSEMSYLELRGLSPGFQSNVRMQLGRVGVPADQFEQRENKELAMADAEDVLAPPLAKGRCRAQRDGGVFLPFSNLMLNCTSGGLPSY